MGFGTQTGDSEKTSTYLGGDEEEDDDDDETFEKFNQNDHAAFATQREEVVQPQNENDEAKLTKLNEMFAREQEVFDTLPQCNVNYKTEFDELDPRKSVKQEWLGDQLTLGPKRDVKVDDFRGIVLSMPLATVENALQHIDQVVEFYKKSKCPGKQLDTLLRTHGIRFAEKFRRSPMCVLSALTLSAVNPM